ncbi:hypothetical protein ACRRVD_03135 [Candidatus Cardinium hertigii]|uniref:hypothetical protein n=1 Tax=Candidatus Cardinium hertigii TaxID=247481 RepID=UPI003D7DCEF2
MANFIGIISSSITLNEQNAVVNSTIVKMIVLAKALLPIFLLIRLMVYYFQNHLNSAQVSKSCYTSLLTLVVTFLLLEYYLDIFYLLDKLTHGIMKQFNWEELVQYSNQSNPPAEDINLNICELIKNSFSKCATNAFKYIAKVMSMTTTIFRHQAIMFTLQVGPLAIAASLLPGNFSMVVSYWFNMLISFLMWGVTVDLLDYSLVTLKFEEINSIGAAISTCLLYGMIGPLTSLYIGNTVGNSIFALGTSQTKQFMSYGTRIGAMVGAKVVPKGITNLFNK